MPQYLSPAFARRLLRDWEAIQSRHSQDRLARIDLMIDVLDATMPAPFTVLDLGSGPGSITRRILERIPRARVIAVDVHPSFVLIGGRALEDYQDRCRWVRTNFRKRDWDGDLPKRGIDGVFSHTALHGLRPDELGHLYQTLARHLRRGGVFLNGDGVPWSGRQKPLKDLSGAVREIRTKRGARGSQQEFSEGFAKWWARARTVDELRRSIEQWDAEARKEYGKPVQEKADLETHLKLLHLAGFREATVVWQNLDVRVVLAVK